jgi:DNA-binding response OmpR family regulator
VEGNSFLRRMSLPPVLHEVKADAAEPVRFGVLEMRPAEYGVLVQGRRLHVTVREFQVLWALAQHHDTVVDRHRIYEEVWGSRMVYRDRSVDTFIRKVRLKLAAAAPDWVFIHTHFGIGYRFAPERLEPEPAR